MKNVFKVLVVVALLVAPLPAAAAEAGFALRFDGVSDYVQLSPVSSMMASTWATTKSVALWIKPTGVPVCTGPDPASCDAIFGDKPRTWGISRGVVGGSDRIWIWNYDGTFDRVGIEYTVGTWVHIALVHSGGQLSAYKNGVLVGSVASGATTVVAQTVLHFGGIITNASKNWTTEGDLDEVQIWNTALSASDVVYSMNNNLTGSESGLAAYYRMSSGSGETVTDDSGHGWTGSLKDGGSGVPPDSPITWVQSGAFGGGSGTPINTPPVADPQSISTAEDTPVSTTLTGSDPDGPTTLTFRVVTAPTHGTVSGTAPNVTYTPAADYNGADSFAFVANDGFLDSAPQTVSITVTAVNDAPVAVDDAVQTAFETAIVINAIGNDFDVDGDVIFITEVGTASHGTTSATSSHITYTPATGFIGTDSITYTISDNHGGFSTATVQVTVRQPGADPGSALRFDGTSDFVRLAPTANIMAASWTTTKTVELWVRITGTPFCNAPSAGSCDAIVGDRPRWWGISHGIIGGQDRVWVWNYDGSMQQIPIPYTAGEWMHIALVHGGGVLSAYKNGVLVGTVASGATQQPLTGALPILNLGGVINTVDRNWTFKGDLDEVRIWNTTRSAAEITGSMNAPLTGGETGLAAYYRMTDGAGLNVTDDSGHGWTGSIQDGGQGVPADGPATWVPSGAFVTP